MSYGTSVSPELESSVEDFPHIAERPDGPPPSFPEPPNGSGDDGRDDQPEPPLNNGRLGVMLFLGAEVMFFSGLLSAFLVFRTGSTVWPPPFQPRLPIIVTAFNTVILVSSGYTMFRALSSMRRGNSQALCQWLRVTVLLGGIFLVVQGYEWARLLQFGLTLSSGVYGATFYTLIGCHAAHVFGALIWLLSVLFFATRQHPTTRRHVAVQLCGMYWYFVVALWPILFFAVYLY
jgi:heme/copper-type cytochrome/quinol oxidase subunit 3